MSDRSKNNPNFFCFACGLYTQTNQRQLFTNAIKTGYRLSFDRILKNGNQSWEPRYCCPTCAIELKSACQGDHPNLNFCTPMLRNESPNHDVDCYFCNTTYIKRFNAKNKQQIVYADDPSMAKPVLIDVQYSRKVLEQDKKGCFCQFIVSIIEILFTDSQ